MSKLIIFKMSKRKVNLYFYTQDYMLIKIDTKHLFDLMYTGWSKKKVLLRLSSITFNNEQLKSIFKMI